VNAENLVDLTADLEEIAKMDGRVGDVDELLDRALDSLSSVVAYDLAAVLELEGDQLRVRAARGRLADPRVRAHRLDLGNVPAIGRALSSGKSQVLADHDHEAGGDPYHGVLDLPHGHSCMVVPLKVGEAVLGAMTFDRERCATYDEGVVQLASAYGHIIALGMLAARQAQLLEAARRQLQQRNRLLENEVARTSDYERSRSQAVRHMATMARQVAATDSPVLIIGETGVGKEVLSRQIHRWSARCEGPFLTVHCAALPDNLIESELFGHTRGAFSGAMQDRPGRFAVANGGTLLLDEIGDLPLPAQAKLLRVLEDGSFEPVGGDRSVKVDVRILSASHVDLEGAIAQGRFREDLFYRLNLFPLRVPPLRERLDDIPLIAEELLADLHRRTGRGPWRLPARTVDRLREHPWPGNVRELINALERATISTPEGDLAVPPFHAAPLPRGTTEIAVPAPAPAPASPEPEPAPEPFAPQPLVEIEKRHIRRVLDLTGGRIYGAGGAAEMLGLKPSTLQSRMAKHGIKRA